MVELFRQHDFTSAHVEEFNEKTRDAFNRWVTGPKWLEHPQDIARFNRFAAAYHAQFRANVKERGLREALKDHGTDDDGSSDDPHHVAVDGVIDRLMAIVEFLEYK